MKTFLFLILTSVSLIAAKVPPEIVLQPNIVLIMADDVGCEPIGAYGGERWKTPHIDALAKGGMRFDYCFSMPVCHPTRICLMTGKYPFRLKSGWGSFPKVEEKKTVAQVLKKAGYATAIAGKWQLCLMKKDIEQPARMGFDQWSVFGWHEGARFHEPMIYEDGRLRTDTKAKYGPNLYVDFLGRFMEKSSEAKKPFFAYYSMALAHDVTDDIPKQVPYVPGKDRWMNYGEMVESMDDMIGKLVSKIDQLGLRKNTIILFTGDNGTATSVTGVMNGRTIKGGKGSMPDSGNHVPFIARWSGTIKAGRTTRAIVNFSDILPTVAEIAGTKVEHKIDGVSFLGHLKGGKPAREVSYCWYARNGGTKGKEFARTADWKLYPNGKFYNVYKDVLEKNPVSPGKLNSKTRVIRAQLQKELDRMKGTRTKFDLSKYKKKK